MIKAAKSYDINYIDCSGMCTFERCPARYLFNRLEGLKSPDAMTIHVDYGTDIHAALPHCYRGKDGLDEAAKVFDDGWLRRSHGQEDKKRNSQRARMSLLNFIESHSQTSCPYEILPIASQIAAPEADRISDNEVPFAVDIGGPLSFLGRLDLPVLWKDTGHKWALDYKTASEISARYFRNFENSPQAVGYTLALSILTEEDIKGMIIEAVRVSPKNDETQLQHIWVTKKQMMSFTEFANRTALSIRASNERQVWIKKPTGCGPYSMFGQPGFYCEYADLCNSENWEDMMRFYKREKPFHPFKITR